VAKFATQVFTQLNMMPDKLLLSH